MSYRLRIGHDDIRVDGNNSLLEQLSAAGLRPPYSCRNGNCGLCDAQLLSGEVQLNNGAHQQQGNIPLCIARPRSDLTLRLQVEQTHGPQLLACQPLEHENNRLWLRLPAGRQPPLTTGDRAALLLDNRVVTTRLLTIEQRRVALQLQQALTAPQKSHSTLPVLLIGNKSGNWQLWSQNAGEKNHCLWTDATARDAQSALDYYRQRRPQQRFWISPGTT